MFLSGPIFNEQQALAHVRSAIKLSGEDKIHRVQAFLLARKPDDTGDLLIEQFEDRGFEVEIYQDADTVGTDVPTYFAVVTNRQTKTQYGSVVGDDCSTIQDAKNVALTNIEKRLKQRKP